MILSICIPTFNRAKVLGTTIQSIVSSPTFQSGEVEIVISDNASTDETQEIVASFQKEFANIRYQRNPSNIGFHNLASALRLGRGDLLKLHNDYSEFVSGGLAELLHIAKREKGDRPQIFIGNGNVRPRQPGSRERVRGFEQFVGSVTFWVSFAGSFCIWRKDLEGLIDKPLNPMFPHVSLLLALSWKECYLIEDVVLFRNQPINNKGGYNLFRVFAVDLLLLLDSSPLITGATFERFKLDLLRSFLVPWYRDTVLFRRGYRFETNGVRRNMRVYYSNLAFFFMVFVAAFQGLRSLAARGARALFAPSPTHNVVSLGPQEKIVSGDRAPVTGPRAART